VFAQQFPDVGLVFLARSRGYVLQGIQIPGIDANGDTLVLRKGQDGGLASMASSP
jgi:hypothetical protein